MAKRKKTKKRKFNKPNWGNAVQRDAERQKQAASSYGFLRLPKGVPIFNVDGGSRVKIDIMPYVVAMDNHPDKYEDEGIAMPGELWYKLPFKIHRNIGVENDAVVCPRSFGKPCPICEYREKRLKEGANWKDDEIKEIKASQRNLYVVIPRGSKEYEEIPHIWEMSQFLFQNLLNQELEEDEDNAVFPDLEAGKTLRVRFDKQQLGKNSFAEASRIDFYDRKEGYDESILDEIPVLDECLEVLSYKELEAKFLEIDPEDIADEDEEIVDGDDWEDPEDDEPAPKRRKKSAKKKPEPEPEEEDEDEDDWEEDEPFEDDELLDEDEEWEEEFEEEFGDLEEEFDDEDEWEEEDEEEKEPEPPKKKKTTKRVIKRKKK